MRRNLWAAWGAVGLILLVSMLTPRPDYAAQNNAIHLSVEAGFQGRFREGSWVPLLVTVSNTGADMSGELRVRTGSTLALAANIYTTPIDLPTQSNKRLFLYAVLDVYAQQVTLDLVAPDGAIVQSASASVTRTDPADLLYAVVTESPTGSIDLTGAHGSGSAYQADWGVDNLPPLPQALQGLDALLITDVDTGRLTLEQRAAIRDWVLSGGHLLVTGGPNWQKTRAGIDGLLPVAAGSTTTVNDLNALPTFAGVANETAVGSAIVTSGQLRSGAVVLVSQNNLPLLLRGAFGQGTVDYLAADPGLEPFRSWNDRVQLWIKLLTTSSRKPGWSEGVVSTDDANRAANFIKGLRLPDILQLAGFLAVYILLIGPVNYFVLRRLRRLEWAWLTIPVIILAASITTYVTGFTLRGTQATLNRISLIQIWPGADQAQLDGVLGVLSPRRAVYSLRMDQGITLRKLVVDNNAGLNNDLSSIKIVEGLRYGADDVPVDAGISTAFVTGGYIAAPALSGTATLSLAIDGSASISGEVRNNSTIALTDALVLAMNTPIHIGALAPGETRPFQSALKSLDLAAPSAGNRVLAPGYTPNNGYPYSQRSGVTLRELLNSSFAKLTPNSNTLLQQEYRRRDLFLAGLTSSDDNGSGRGVDAFFVGWSDTSPVGVSLDAAYTSEDTTLYLVKLATQLRSPDSTVRLLPGYMQWTPLGNKTLQRDFSPYQLYLTAGEEAEFRFDPLPALRLDSVSRLTINVRTNSSDPGSLALWDWKAGQYVVLDRQTGPDYIYTVASSGDIGKYVGPGNAVQIRVDPTSGATSFDHIDVTLDGILNGAASTPPSQTAASQ